MSHLSDLVDLDNQIVQTKFVNLSALPRRAESAEIAKQIDRFLNLGGSINQVPIRINATPCALNNAARDDERRNKLRRQSSAMRATTINRTSPKLWAKNAAEYCGIPYSEFLAMELRGEGPQFVTTARANKKQYEVTVLDAWHRARQK